MSQEVPLCLEREIWQFLHPQEAFAIFCTFLHASTFLTPHNSLRRHVALRWLAGWWWAPPRVFTLRRFHPCGPRLVILGLFSTEKGLGFSGLDPSFVSSDTEGPPPPLPPPPPPGCSSHGGWCFGLELHAVFNACDILRSRSAISSKMHVGIPDVCVRCRGLMEGFSPNCRTSPRRQIGAITMS